MLYVLTISFSRHDLAVPARAKIVPGAIAIRVGFRSQVVSALFITLRLRCWRKPICGARAAGPYAPAAGRFRSLAVLLLGGVLALDRSI